MEGKRGSLHRTMDSRWRLKGIIALLRGINKGKDAMRSHVLNKRRGKNAVSRKARGLKSEEQRDGAVNSGGNKYRHHCRILICEPRKSREGPTGWLGNERD
jgi:hypothetical protein